MRSSRPKLRALTATGWGLGILARRPILLLFAVPPLAWGALVSRGAAPIIDRLANDLRLHVDAVSDASSLIRVFCAAAADAGGTVSASWLLWSLGGWTFAGLVLPLATAWAIWTAYGALDTSHDASDGTLGARLPAVLVANLLVNVPMLILDPSFSSAFGAERFTADRCALLLDAAWSQWPVILVLGAAVFYARIRLTFLLQAIVIDGEGPLGAFRRSWRTSAWRSSPIVTIRFFVMDVIARLIAWQAGCDLALATALVSPLEIATLTAAYVHLRGGVPESTPAPIGTLATAR